MEQNLQLLITIGSFVFIAIILTITIIPYSNKEKRIKKYMQRKNLSKLESENYIVELKINKLYYSNKKTGHGNHFSQETPITQRLIYNEIKKAYKNKI